MASRIIFVTNFSEELNTLYSNLGEGLFEDVTTKAGLGSGFIPLGFGTKLFDVDNDGDLDIHVTNGHVIDNVKLYQPNLTYAQKDLLYENIGGRFRDVSAQSGPALQAERVGRGLAVADFDNDGNLDVVISSVGRAPVLLEEPGRRQRQLDHHQGARARRATASASAPRCECRRRPDVQVREINNVASYLSANDIRLHVGLGTAKTIQQIDVLVAERHEADAEGRRRQSDPGHQGTLTALPCCRVRASAVAVAGWRAGAGGRPPPQPHRAAVAAREECLSRQQHRRHTPRTVRFRRRPRHRFAARSRSILGWPSPG